jgi:hypothetical protein
LTRSLRYAGALLALSLVAGGSYAVAGSLITSKDIADGTVRCKDLRSKVCEKIKKHHGSGKPGPVGPRGPAGPAGPQGPKGDPGLTGLESDGPYPGATDLGDLGTNGSEGDNSNTMWDNNGDLQTSWVKCPAGKTALGGGFHTAADAGEPAQRAVIVSVSEPTQIVGGAPGYEPIAGDEAGSIRPNGWLVQGYNDGAADVIVRPWVVCAVVK